MENEYNSEAFEKIWLAEAEIKSRASNRFFCITFLICNPASSIAFYLSGDPFFYILLTAHLFSSSIILIYLVLNKKKLITGQQMTFYTQVTLTFFYAFLLAQPHVSYIQSSLNLTLAAIFCGTVLRWPIGNALTCSALSIGLFPLSTYMASEATMIRFFEDGGIFVVIANLMVPFFVYLTYSRDKRDFFFRYSLQKQNEELEKQKTIAENATRAKSDFLSMMSHEIRTPLNGIVGIVHLMMQEEGKSEKSNELIQTLKFSSDHLMAVVNDVLDFNKINSNHVVLYAQPFETRLLFENLRNMFLPRATEKNIQLIFDIDPDLPPQLITDKVRLNQIITNLVHNAIKFTNQGWVRFSVKVQDKTAEFVRLQFEVADTGIGIPLAEQSEIFDLFIQAKPKINKESGGTGLGLAITKQLLKLFESEVTLVSEEGKGSSFSFPLRLAYSEGEKKEQIEKMAVTEPNVNQQVKVLVVDDNKTNVVFATQLLKRRDILFDVAHNGQEAYNLFSKESYKLILMDLRMPIMDGFESTALIRKVDKDIPIIALTASAFEDEKERAMESGFSGYLTKPFVPTDFYNYILPYLGAEPTAAEIEKV